MSWTEDEDQQKSLEKKHETAESRTEDAQDSERLDPNKEIWALLEKTLNDNLIEKRRARRWRIFFRFTTLAIFLAVIGGWFAKSNFQDVSLEGDVVAMIPMRGGDRR